MRVAIVGINYAPDPTGIPVYTTGLAEFLVTQGHTVTMYTGFPYYPRWAKDEQDKGRLFRRDMLNGVAVRRHYLYVPSRPSALKRMLHELSFVASVTLGYLFGPKADLTIVISPPLFIGIPVTLIARLKRSRTILHVQDLQPDAAVDLGMLKPGPLTSLFYFLEKITYRLADRISTISHGMLEKIASKGVPRHKLTLFRNWAHDNLIFPMAPDTRYRQDWDLTGKFVVLYSGNMGVKQGLDSVLRAAVELNGHSDVVFVIVGDGGEKEALMELARAMKLDNVQFRPLQSMERLSELLATADVAIVPQKRGVKDIVLPSKLGNLLASGRPVIAAAEPDTDFGKIVLESGCGVLVEPGNGEQIAAAILGMRQVPDDRTRMGDSGRRYMEVELSGAAILGGIAGRIEALGARV
jgi:colanic acid biosynthesis glycosyl transferase WcaI